MVRLSHFLFNIYVEGKMKKIVIILVSLIFVSFLFISCQKAKEPEGKEAQVRTEEVKQPSEAKPEIQPKQQEQPITQEVKEGGKEIPRETKTSPLTEKEQRYILKWDEFGPPELSVKEALKSLRLLLKAEPKQIRHYVEAEPGTWSYIGDICKLIGMISGSGKKEAFDLLLEVLEKRKNYPGALACAIKHLQRFNDKSIIPALKEYIAYRYLGELPNTSDPEKWLKKNETDVRLQTAGTLLALGEGDIALPVLDELARQGEWEALAKLFKTDKEGVVHWSTLKFWDERGLEIIKRALDYPSDEVKGWAAIALASLNVEKEKTEEVALNIVKKYMYKTEKDYGIGRKTILGETYTEEYLLPGYEGKDIKKLKEQVIKDTWACWRSIFALGKLKSRRAVLLLKHIKENNTEGYEVCWEHIDGWAESALKLILEDEGGK